VALVHALLEKDPTKRPATARAVESALGDIALGLGLDEGLMRHAARLARTAPRREASAREIDGRRRTQRVLAADAGAVAVASTNRLRRPLFVGGVAAVVALGAGAMGLFSPPPVASPVVVTPLPDTPAPAPAPPTTAVGPVLAVVDTPAPAPAPPPKKSEAKSERPKKSEPKADAPPPTSDKAAKGFGYLSLQCEPWASVTIDGQLVKAETPLVRSMLPAGRHTVVLHNPKVGLTKTVVIDITPDVEVKKSYDLYQ
jgi:hypothetical protein